MSLVNSRLPLSVLGVSLVRPALTMVNYGLAPIFSTNENDPTTDNHQIVDQMTLMSIARITALTADATSATKNYTSISVAYKGLTRWFGSISAISAPAASSLIVNFKTELNPALLLLLQNRPLKAGTPPRKTRPP